MCFVMHPELFKVDFLESVFLEIKLRSGLQVTAQAQGPLACGQSQ